MMPVQLCVWLYCVPDCLTNFTFYKITKTHFWQYIRALFKIDVANEKGCWNGHFMWQCDCEAKLVVKKAECRKDVL